MAEALIERGESMIYDGVPKIVLWKFRQSRIYLGQQKIQAMKYPKPTKQRKPIAQNSEIAQVKKIVQLIAACILIMLSVSAVVAGIAHLDIETFENDLVKSLKEKFKTFYTKAENERVYIQTDKTFYMPGETIWFSAYVRDEKTLKPSSNSDIIHIEFITPRGSTEKHYKIVAKNGSAQCDFNLSGHPGGIYKIKAYTEWQKNEDSAFLFEKEITVQSVVMPRLKMKLDFEKKAYGKGDEVVAKLELNTNENKPLANTKVKFTAQLEGKSLSENSVTTDASGKVNLKFQLPQNLNSTDGIVNAMIDFEGSTESISRSVPIVLNKIALEFFPEGGDMVANTNSRVAFRAVNEFNKAADVEGIIVDSKGAFVTKFSSYHFGMGSFDFVPKQNETYKARITKPEGILDEFNLPDVLRAGYTLRMETQHNNIHCIVNNWQSEEMSMLAQTRGKIYFAKSFKAAKGANIITINAENFPIGVSQVTLFDSKGIARAERLVFVGKDKQLNISVTTGKEQYQPREKVTMNIRVTDNNGLPVPGSFSLSVVDDNLLSFADDKQGNILSKILLEPELKEKVEEPNFYFNKKEAKADRALDLLMMTSGWRKYSWQQINDEEFPQIMHAAEKAEFSGIVYNGYTYKPLQGAQIKMTGTTKSTITDKDGKFTFSRFDITSTNKIQITADGYSPQTQVIYNYGNSYSYYLYDQSRVMQYRAAPMAVGRGGAEKRIEMVMENEGDIDFAAEDVQRVFAIATKKNKVEQQVQAAVPVADWMNVPKDLTEDPKDNNPITVIDEHKLEKTKVVDLRFTELENFDKNSQQQNAVVFYRAKEFPKKNHPTADTTRNDFASTVFWSGNVVTDQGGRAKVEFVTNDLVSSFKTTVEGFGVDGSIGRTETNFSTNLPFGLDAKIPTELVVGDKLMIPVFMKNNTSSDVSGHMFIAAPKQLSIISKHSDVMIAAQQSKLIFIEAIAANQIGEGQIEIRFNSSKFNDAIVKNISVVAKGFPANISLSGQDLEKEFFINPTKVVEGSMKVDFHAYPNIMTELMSGVESILREPYGCFEQTSSSTYPNIMALQYLKTMKIDDPKIQARATKLLEDGYKKLVAFETKENGYEWFGAAPAHEALTAYGLMEFVDMKSVYAGVDDKMIERTAKLLMEKRDGDGGFKKNPRALDSFGGADADITNAYIVYALSEAGYRDIAKELNAVEKEARRNNDPYLMALCANALLNVGEHERGEKMVAQLISARNEAGFWTGKKHSITRSAGASLKTETTALILLAMLKTTQPDVTSVTSAVKFLVGARSGYGGFGSTQATVLSLKSLTKYAEFAKKTDEDGTIEILINNKMVAEKSYTKGERNNIVIEGLEKFVQQGNQKVEVRFKDCKQALPYAMNVSYHTTIPESSKLCVVEIETKLSARQVKVGETLRLSTTIKNKTSEGQPMTMAIIGIPAGFGAQPWQLREMMEKGTIDFYEIVGNNIACYYRDLAPNEQKQINLDLKAEIPGEFAAPASSAYLYYTNENKVWVGLDKVLINQ